MPFQPQWNAGVVGTLGSGLTLASGTLAATGGGGGGPAPLTLAVNGSMPASGVLGYVLAAQTGTLAANLANAFIGCQNPPTADVTGNIFHNYPGPPIYSFTIAAGATAGTFTALAGGAAVPIAAGDNLFVPFSVPADATAANFCLAIPLA